jgi:streptogramin lyase
MGTFGLCLLVLGTVLSQPAARVGAAPLVLHPVPLPVQSPRLLGMSMDEDGFIWLGSTHRTVYRYDPRAGAVEEVKLPYDSSINQTICVGKKVYLLGQSYPKLMIYDRADKTFREAAYPTAKPDVWYGTEAVDGRHLYLFDRGPAGVIKWDATADAGKVIAYPYKTPMPSLGRYVASDRAVWCGVWDFTGGQYVPLGIARLDTKTDEFTGWFPFPAEDADRKPFTDPDATLFYPHTLKGKLVPFDFKERRWCKALVVPDFGRRFGFIGGGTAHDGRWYFSLSTYNGTATGCDGKPYHFCNGLLEFDPRTSRFAVPTLEVEGAYFQVAYTLSAGGHLFATGNNIRERDGSLNMGRMGEAIFWQTLRPKPR